MKNKLGKIKKIDLSFTKKDNWLRINKRTAYDKCQNCGKKYEDSAYEFIVFASVEGKSNTYICEDCGKFFISEGAVDIQKQREKDIEKKQKFIKQAKRIGVKPWPAIKYLPIDVLKNEIQKAIKNERGLFHIFLKLKDRKNVEIFTKELNKQKDYTENPIIAFDVWKNTSEFLCNYSTDEDCDHRCGISYFTVTQNIGDKIFKYRWANANGDNSLEDAGFNVLDAWSTMVSLNPKDSITDSQVLEWILNIDAVINPQNLDLNVIKEEILKNQK